MLKKELVYRELLWLAERDGQTTRRASAKTCAVSLNLVNSVTREFKRIDGIEMHPMRMHITRPAKSEKLRSFCLKLSFPTSAALRARSRPSS